MKNIPDSAQLDFTDKKITFLMPRTKSGYEDNLLKELNNITPLVTVAQWGEDIFTAGKDSLVIIAGAHEAPAGTNAQAAEFLKKGGRLLTLGGPPFMRQMHDKGGEWYSFEELTEQFAKIKKGKTLIINPGIPGELGQISTNTNNPKDSVEVEFGDYSAPSGNDAVKIRIADLAGWSNAKKSVKIPAGDNAVGFWAKGSKRTTSICMELSEDDGSRWIATTPISEEWRYYVLTAGDYKFWSGSTSKGRGKAGDVVNMQAASFMTIGLAQSHTPVELGEHEFYLADFASAAYDAVSSEKTVMEGLSPEYKFYPISNGAQIKCFDNQIFVRSGDYKLTEGMFSISPRPQGTGFMMGRKLRFIPLLEVYDDKDMRSGFAAWMYAFTPADAASGTYEGARLAGFGVNDPEFYNKAGISAVCDTVRALLLDAILLEGGADEYIYLHDTEGILTGAHTCFDDKFGRENARVELTLKTGDRILSQTEYAPGDRQSVLIKNASGFKTFKNTLSWETAAGKPDKAVCVLKFGALAVDRIEQDITYWAAKPQEERKYITIENNEFMRDGQPIRFYGVNYMPSSGIAIEAGKYFEHYVSRESYDPDVFYKDLVRVREIGFNAVSVFVYYETISQSANILHLINMCGELGLYVDLSLRPYANPLTYNEMQVQTLIEKLRFPENDNIIAYDIAWERAFGTYDGDYGNYAGRKTYDTDWHAWIEAQYGSLENAEAVWGEPVPRDDSGNRIIGVPDNMLRDGEGHERLVAAYRRFADDFISSKHAYAADHIKSIDKNHLISVRTGGPGSVPLADPAAFGYDFAGALASSMDFMSPESYALTPEPYSMRQGIFTNIYARYANSSPVVWKEYGRHIWTGSNFGDNSRFEKLQAEYYTLMNDMMLLGHTGGAYCWWWAGGYRVGENSDFGVVNPDGSDRMVTGVLRDYSSRFLSQPKLPKADYLITLDRDAFRSGLKGLYESIEDELFAAVDAGKTVAFKSGGEEFDTSNVPALGLGGIEYTSQMPLRYVNGQIRKVEIIRGDGTCADVGRGSSVKTGGEFTLRVTVCNTGHALWVSGGTGKVMVVSLPSSGIKIKNSIPKDVPYLGMSAAEGRYSLSENKAKVTLRFEAQDRFVFGDEFSFELTR